MGNYRSVSAMAKDIDLLTKNAKNYNEPGSQVFKVSINLSVSLSVCLCVYLSPVKHGLLFLGRKHHQKVICPEEGRHGPRGTHQVQHTHQVDREKSPHLWESPRYSQSHPFSPIVCQLLP